MLDTQLLIWTSAGSDSLPSTARQLIADEENELYFSVVSLWEIAIKRALERDDFQIDPSLLRRLLITNEYNELTVLSDHAIAVGNLPPIHKDPFDRLLLAQATVEGITLLTADQVPAQYEGPVMLVR